METELNCFPSHFNKNVFDIYAEYIDFNDEHDADVFTD